MTVTAASTGTQTATIGTEHTLFDTGSAPNTAGTYTLHVDCNAMAAGDVLELRIYQMVLTSGTRRVAYIQRYFDAQSADDQIKLSVPISNELTDSGALRFTLKQTAGTGRAYPWKCLAYR